MTAAEADGSNAFGWIFRMPIDSKAMRKWGDNEILVGVVEVESEVGTVSIRVAANTRLLLKLS